MADGSLRFNFPLPQKSLLRPGEIVVDLFAGGGGASEGLKQAIGIDPALAYNHDEQAIGMHAANHPLTQHHREDIWHADPRVDVAGRAVGWFHASPDCTHFSQAKGGQPRSRKTRALSWVVLKWAGQLGRTGNAPRIISVENVWQILTWGPLVAKRCKATGRVLKMDGSVAGAGERVPVENQQLVPDKRHSGRTWGQFIAALRGLGYAVEWRKLTASDYGAGTSRERLFLLARRDGEPIVWPAPTHGKAPGLQPQVTAADSLDFSDLGRSIFDRPRPLADATLRRIAKGIKRHVVDAAEPFFLTEFANASAGRTWSALEPLRTQCAGVKGGHFALVTALLEQANGGFAADNSGHDLRKPISTITASGSQQRLVTVQLEEYDAPNGSDHGCNRSGALRDPARRNDLAAQATQPWEQRGSGGSSARGIANEERLPRDQDGRSPKTALGVRASAGLDGAGWSNSGGDADQPQGRGQDQQQPVESGAGDSLGQHPARLRHGAEGAPAQHAGTKASLGEGRGEGAALDGDDVSADRHATEHLADAGVQSGALQVAAFITTYYGNGQAVSLRDPLDTVTTRDRMALVTVHVRGTPYVITDIRLRMLKPRELFTAQGFPPDYIIDRTANGTPLTTTAAVRMVGNSVSPPPIAALARANLDSITATAMREAA